MNQVYFLINRLSLRKKFRFIFLSVSCVTFQIFCLLVFFIVFYYISSNESDNFVRLLKMYSDGFAKLIHDNDVDKIQKEIKKLSKEEMLTYIDVRDIEKKSYITYFNDVDIFFPSNYQSFSFDSVIQRKGMSLYISMPVFFKSGLIGFIDSIYSLDRSARMFLVLFIIFSILNILLFFVLFFIINFSERLIFKPIENLTKSIQSIISKGNYKNYFRYNKKDEIGDLVSYFNRMMFIINEKDLEKSNFITALEKEKSNLKNALNVKTNFLARMSHELRTPLNAVVNYIDIIEEDIVSDKGISKSEIHDYSECIRFSVRHLLGIISDILDLSRIESQNLGITLSKVELVEIIQECLSIMSPIQEKSCNEILFQSNAKIYVLGDRLRIRQCIINILNNACKFCTNGKITINLSDYHKKQNTYTCVSISDTGIGMNEEELSCLFNMFTQVDESPERRYDGAGLGLYITQNLLFLMDGFIEVGSKKNHGTTFNLFFRSYSNLKKEG